jgi:hypothetical protein
VHVCALLAWLALGAHAGGDRAGLCRHEGTARLR